MTIPCNDCTEVQRCLRERSCGRPLTANEASAEMRAALDEISAAIERLRAAWAAYETAELVKRGRLL